MDVREEIADLRRQITEHNRSYYDLDAPTISDFEYEAQRAGGGEPGTPYA